MRHYEYIAQLRKIYLHVSKQFCIFGMILEMYRKGYKTAQTSNNKPEKV